MDGCWGHQDRTGARSISATCRNSSWGCRPKQPYHSPMSDRLPSRITIAAAAAHYGRSRRWVRLHVAALSEAAHAALQPGTHGPRHERSFDRVALFALLDHVLGVSADKASSRLRHLSGYVGSPRRRNGEGATLCERPRCARPVEGRRRLCDLHTTARARQDRLRRAGPRRRR